MNKKGVANIVVILIIVVVAIVVVAGYLVFKNKSSAPSANQNSTSTSQVWEDDFSETQGNHQIASETANWQTYKNEKYGFEFRYPSNWVITLDADTPNQSALTVMFSDNSGKNVFIAGTGSSDDLKNFKTGFNSIKEEKNITLLGLPATMVIGTQQHFDGSGKEIKEVIVEEILVAVQKSGTVYILSGPVSADIMNQILSTLKIKK